MEGEQLEFGWIELDHLVALIQELNARGIPYKLCKDMHAIKITIGKGY